MKYMKSERDT